MLSIILFVLAAYFNTTLPEVDKNDIYIHWNENRLLEWNDFQGTPNPDSDIAALTSSGIMADFSFGKNGLSYSIKCRFNKERSWVRIKTDVILKHEQGHFDITEIFARKFNKALKEYVYNEKTVNKDIQLLYQKIQTDHHAFQIQYDKETNHSLNIEQQKLWEEKIKSSLKELDDFKNYHS